MEWGRSRRTKTHTFQWAEVREALVATGNWHLFAALSEIQGGSLLLGVYKWAAFSSHSTMNLFFQWSGRALEATGIPISTFLWEVGTAYLDS